MVIAFVFFRAASFRDAWVLLTTVATGTGLAAAATERLACTVAAIVLLDLPLFLTDLQVWPLRLPLALRVGVYTMLMLALITLSGQQSQSFIYFAF